MTFSPTSHPAFRRTTGALALSSLLSLAGCYAAHVESDALDEPEIAEQNSSIIGGVRTSAEPAIGKLTDVAGNLLCTATLISTKVILTAAHCVNFDSTKSGLATSSSPPNYAAPLSAFAFTMTDASGATQTRRLRRFLVASAFHGRADIAVAELDGEVSWSFAPWLKLGTTRPADYEEVRVYGYGCVAGTADLARGQWNADLEYLTGQPKTTRVVAWDAPNYRPRTTVSCAGDSGGPIVNSRNEIIAINSNGVGTGAGASALTDTPADVVEYNRFIVKANSLYGKRQICTVCPTAAIRPWRNTYYLQAVDNGENGDVNAIATSQGSWETVRILDLGTYDSFTANGWTKTKYQAIQTTGGRWLFAENGGGARLRSGSNYITQNETFQISQSGTAPYYSIGNMNRSQFVCAENTGGGAVNVNRGSVGDWEKFNIVKSSDWF